LAKTYALILCKKFYVYELIKH